MPHATLAGAIEALAGVDPKVGFKFLSDRTLRASQIVTTHVPYPDLEARTRRLAAALGTLGLRKGDRVALIIADNQDFVALFLCGLRSGVVPVPIYPPHTLTRIDHYLDGVAHILTACEARVVVASDKVHRLLGGLGARVGTPTQVVRVSALDSIDAPFQPARVMPDDVAFLQFTSGSTSRPKGVVLTHANLMANIGHFLGPHGLQVGPDDSAVSWLPLYHDMGLIGFVLGPMTRTRPVHFMPPLVFLKRPSLWLSLMSAERATISFSPNFGFALCNKRAPLSELEGVDLSAWRASGTGGEPIRAEVMAAFAARFAPVGFRAEAHVPTYGLAESSLAVTFSPLGRGVQTRRFELSSLVEAQRAVEAEGDGSIELVACGRWFDGHDLAIFSPDDGADPVPLEAGRVGEIRIRGPSVTRGYWGDEAASRAAFADGWLKTGDIGFIHEGWLYVCGRLKELIIIHGRNYYPQDIEHAVSQVDGIRRGNIIAFGVEAMSAGDETGGHEAVVILAERKPDEALSTETLASQVHEQVRREIGVEVREVLLLEPGSLPKTSSGKLQRVAARQRYLADGNATARPASALADRVQLVKTLLSSQLGHLRSRLKP